MLSVQISRRTALTILTLALTNLTTTGDAAAACPPPAAMLAKLVAEAVAARNAHVSTNVDSSSPHKANASQTTLWHQNEAAIEELQGRLKAKHRYASGRFPSTKAQTEYWHDFAMGIAIIVKSNRISGKYSANCIGIASVMYSNFYTKYSGVEISIFSKVKVTIIGRHAFLVVHCGKDLYIVDGWKDGGVAYGPLVYDAGKGYLVDPKTGDAPTPYYAEKLEILAGPTPTTGTTTF